MRLSNFRRPRLSSGSSGENNGGLTGVLTSVMITEVGTLCLVLCAWYFVLGTLRFEQSTKHQVLRSKAVFLQPAIQRAATEAESFGGAVGVAFEACEGLFDQQSLGIFEAHFFEAR